MQPERLDNSFGTLSISILLSNECPLIGNLSSIDLLLIAFWLFADCAIDTQMHFIICGDCETIISELLFYCPSIGIGELEWMEGLLSVQHQPPIPELNLALKIA